jgi:capsular polysaccharide biosynthesis protein
MLISSATEKPDALMALAVAAGFGAVDPWADTAGHVATAIAEILPAETNRGVALRAAATLRDDARRLVFPGRARDLRPPVHYHRVPPGFTHASREALSPDVNLLDLADGVFCHLADMPLALTADATVALKDFSSRYAPLLHYYDVDLQRLAADAVAVPGPLLVIADDVRPLNFSHWVLDWLPRIACLTSVAPRAETFIAVPPLPAKPYLRETLAAWGFADARILEIGRMQAVRARRLLVPDDLGIPPHPGHKGAPWLTRFLRDQLARDAAKRPQWRKIYVARDDGEGRRVADDAALTAELAALGYARIVPGDMTFAEQVTAFASASHIIATHGAGLALLAFASADARVLEIFPESYGTAAYYVLAASLGLDYASYVAPAIRRDRTQLDDIALDVPAFVAAVRARFDQGDGVR